MTATQFLDAVRERGTFPSRDAAELATRATLATLAARLKETGALDIASQLPTEIAAFMLHDATGARAHLGTDDFVHVAAIDEGAPDAEAERHARAVFAVLREAISPGEVADLRAQLPPDLRAFFDDASVG